MKKRVARVKAISSILLI